MKYTGFTFLHKRRLPSPGPRAVITLLQCPLTCLYPYRSLHLQPSPIPLLRNLVPSNTTFLHTLNLHTYSCRLPSHIPAEYDWSCLIRFLSFPWSPLSSSVQSCPALFCVLFCSVLSRSDQFCTGLFWPVLLCSILSCSVLPFNDLFCPVLYCYDLSCAVILTCLPVFFLSWPSYTNTTKSSKEKESSQGLIHLSNTKEDN